MRSNNFSDSKMFQLRRSSSVTKLFVSDEVKCLTRIGIVAICKLNITLVQSACLKVSILIALTPCASL